MRAESEEDLRKSFTISNEKKSFTYLLQSSSALLEGKSEEEVFNYLLQGVKEIGFDRARIYLLSDDEQYMCLKAHVGVDEKYLKRKQSVNSDWSIRILLTDRKSHIFPHKNDLLEPFIESEDAREVEQWACVPILLKGLVIGKISVDNKVSRRPINNEDLDLLMPFASHAALFINQKKLSEESSLCTKKLETLRRTTFDITSIFDWNELLTTIIEKAVKLVNAEHGVIYRYHPKLNTLTIVACYERPDGILGQSIQVGEGMAGRLVQSDLNFMIVPN